MDEKAERKDPGVAVAAAAEALSTLGAMGEVSHRHHFLPQGAQRPFADERGYVTVVAVDGRRFETSPLDIGLERDLYLRVRPTGQKSDDIERVSLADIENQALPILQNIFARWPLEPRDKLRVATYVGVLLVRGPRWFEWHEQFSKTAYREYLERGEFRALAEEHGVSEETVYKAHVDAELDGTRKLLTMLQIGAKAGSSIGSMTWCLLAFDSPCLAMADHPVGIWPMGAGGRHPGKIDPATTGVLNFLEVRLPVAPDLALLMAWADRPDLSMPLRGASHHARNLNAFSIAQAERHWIHHPQAAIRSGAGQWMPLTTELIDNYSIAVAETSSSRRATSEELNSRLGDESREVRIRFIERATPSLSAK